MDVLERRRLVTAVVTFGLVGSLGCGTGSRGAVGWQIAVDTAEDTITVREDGEHAIFEVRSPRGIGAATVRRVAPGGPRQIFLRFRLRGLEELRFEYDSTAVVASMPATPTREVTQEVRAASEPVRRIDRGDPHWIVLRPLGADGTTADRPAPGGWIEARAPDDFVRRGEREFRIRWIDFYR